MSHLPRLFRIRRHSDPPRLTDIPRAVRSELEATGIRFQAGSRVAIAVGSRGIMNLSSIVQETARWLKEQGAEPFPGAPVDVERDRGLVWCRTGHGLAHDARTRGSMTR